MFRLESLHEAGVGILRVHGNLDHGTVRRVEEAVQHLVEGQDPPRLLIDLTRSPMVDSAGLGVLVKSHKRCAERGGTLKIAGVNDKIAKLLGVTHLTGLFEIYSDAAEGVASFRQ